MHRNGKRIECEQRRFTYTAQRQTRDGLTAVLSAEWDTARDAALAAKLAFNLSPQEMLALETGDTVKSKRGFEILLNSNVRPEVEVL